MTEIQAPETFGPANFKPFSAEISLCECATCRELAYAMSNVLQGPNSRQHKAAARVLLTELLNGRHVRMTLAERAAEARLEKAAKIAAAVEAGASPATLQIMERGYATVKMSDFYATGMGLGVTIR